MGIKWVKLIFGRLGLPGLLVLFGWACQSPRPEAAGEKTGIFSAYHPVLDSIIRTDAGIIAGVELGQPRDAVWAKHVQDAADQDKEGLVYEQVINPKTRYSITYTFENDTISEIEVLVTCSNQEEGEKILNDLKNYYRNKYTAPIMDKGYFVFNCFDSRKKNFKISLTDNGGNSNSLIDLLIYREK